jgi:hypothetical protein
MQEAEQSATTMQTRLGDERDVPDAFAAVMTHGLQLQEASDALRRVLEVVSALEARLSAMRGGREVPAIPASMHGQVVGMRSDNGAAMGRVSEDSISVLPVSTRMIDRSATMPAPAIRSPRYTGSDVDNQP